MSFFTVEGKPIWKPIVIGVAIAAVISLIMTCLFALTINMMPTVPYGIIHYVMIGIVGFSVLLGAYIASAIFKSRGLLIGAICGGIVLLIVTSVGLGMTKNDIGILTLIRSIAILLCGVCGGIAGVNRKEKVRIK